MAENMVFHVGGSTSKVAWRTRGAIPGATWTSVGPKRRSHRAAFPGRPAAVRPTMVQRSPNGKNLSWILHGGGGANPATAPGTSIRLETTVRPLAELRPAGALDDDAVAWGWSFAGTGRL